MGVLFVKNSSWWVVCCSEPSSVVSRTPRSSERRRRKARPFGAVTQLIQLPECKSSERFRNPQSESRARIAA
jgi:hypothetical protein